MRALYISSLVVTVLMFIVVGSIAETYSTIQWDIFLDDLYNSDPYSYNYDDSRYADLRSLTATGGILSLLFTVFYILTFSFTLKNIKRTTAKVMSIIGLSISGIFFLCCLVPIMEPANVAFDDEFAPAMIFYGLIMLAFCIVNLVQAIRNTGSKVSNQELIDDII
jgi:hypothetical protein